MSRTVRVSLQIPTDESGLIGRECPRCRTYFKLKPGTGLPISSRCCPYCEHAGESNDFSTQDQIEYVKSLAFKQVVQPELRKLQTSLRRLESSTRGGLIRIRVKTGRADFPIKYYSERDLESVITCDSCGLVFAIYGVFARCPDCTRLTTMSIFKNSFVITRKQLELFDRIPEDERELREALLANVVEDGVAAFDGLGKRLRDQYPALLPDKPRNLFQNLDALDRALEAATGKSLEQLLGAAEYRGLYRLFQVRHLWEHGFGEVDREFIRKTSADPGMLRTKYPLAKSQVLEFLDRVHAAGLKVRAALEQAARGKGRSRGGA